MAIQKIYYVYVCFNAFLNNVFVDVALSDIGGASSIAPTSVGSSDAIGVASDQANANRLQRQKAGSRKTFKFRKTRKDVSMKLCLASLFDTTLWYTYNF